VFGHKICRPDRSRRIFEQADTGEALNAANAIGDDRWQRSSRGYVCPDSFTRGSSAQRVYWFRQGIEAGSTGQCNTFTAERF
jgi:predicted metalloprotease